MSDAEKYALDVTWSGSAMDDLPTLIGPFDTEQEAAEWARLNLTEGCSSFIRTLAYPYLRGAL